MSKKNVLRIVGALVLFALGFTMPTLNAQGSQEICSAEPDGPNGYYCIQEPCEGMWCCSGVHEEGDAECNL